VIFVFLALRYDYGNDYMGYLEGFEGITLWEGSQISLTGEKWEPGWVLLHIVFRPFGFFALVAFTSLLTCIAFYRFIRNFVPARFQWFAVFLYVFDPYLFLVPASAMRQNVGIILFLFAIEFLCKKKRHIVIYLILAIAAATFHKTAYVLLPLVLLAFINVKINKGVASIVALLFASMFFFGNEMFGYVNILVEMFVPKYANYMLGSGRRLNTGVGFAYAMFQLISILYYVGMEVSEQAEESPGFQEQQHSNHLADEQEQYLLPIEPYAAFPDLKARRLLYKIAIMTFMFTPLALQVGMLGRVNMYFAPVLIAVFPIILCATKDAFFYVIFLYSLIGFTLFRFLTFFLSPVWRNKFGTYQTIFSELNLY